MIIEVLIIFILAVLIDLLLGELPTAIHPVVFMGKFIEMIKKRFLSRSKSKNRILGILMTFFLVLFFSGIFVFLLYISKFNNTLFLITASVLLSTTFAIKYLLKSVYNVYKSLNKDINQGKKALSFLVSRNTENLSMFAVVSAAIETLTENITDSVIAPIFYIFLFSLLAVAFEMFNNSLSIFFIFSSNQFPVVICVIAGVSYRVINTLDAMVGYKDSKNIDIGWFPARTDDYLNYIPARLTGVLVVISSFLTRSNYKMAWKLMFRDANNPPSPNSGYPMAAAAGALNVQLEKPGTYTLGENNENLNPSKILEALKLSIITISLFLLIIISIASVLIIY